MGTDDVVVLTDGSLFRGTILEVVSDDHVDLLVPSGETRHFAMSDVHYVGPYASAPRRSSSPPSLSPPPSPSPPRKPPEPKPANVVVKANEPDVELLVKTGQADFEGTGYAFGRHGGGPVAVAGTSRSYATVCTAPCTAEIPPGTYHFALAQGGGRAVGVDGPTEVDGPSTLRARLQSHSGLRALGIVTLVASGLGGGAMLVAGVTHTSPDCSYGAICVDDPTPDSGLISGGVAVMAIGAIVGTVLLLQHDTATVEVVPLDASHLLRVPGVGAEARDPSARVEGLALRARF